MTACSSETIWGQGDSPIADEPWVRQQGLDLNA
jgi:hypothetical protein